MILILLLVALVIVNVLCGKIVPMVYNFSGLYEPGSTNERFYNFGKFYGNAIGRITVSGSCNKNINNLNCDDFCILVPARDESCDKKNIRCMRPKIMNKMTIGAEYSKGFDDELSSCNKCDGMYRYKMIIANFDFGTTTNFNISVGGCDPGASMNYDLKVVLEYGIQWD